MKEELSPEKLQYIEEAGLGFEKYGLTRMSGRVMGFLMICDKDAVSFDEIRETVQASKGSISGTLKHLIDIRLAEPVSLPGDRKTYYRATKMPMAHLIVSRMHIVEQFAKVFANAYKLKERDDDVSEWLLETTAFYQWMGEIMAGIADQFEQVREEMVKDCRKKLEK